MVSKHPSITYFNPRFPKNKFTYYVKDKTLISVHARFHFAKWTDRIDYVVKKDGKDTFRAWRKSPNKLWNVDVWSIMDTISRETNSIQSPSARKVYHKFFKDYFGFDYMDQSEQAKRLIYPRGLLDSRSIYICQTSKTFHDAMCRIARYPVSKELTDRFADDGYQGILFLSYLTHVANLNEIDPSVFDDFKIDLKVIYTHDWAGRIFDLLKILRGMNLYSENVQLLMEAFSSYNKFHCLINIAVELDGMMVEDDYTTVLQGVTDPIQIGLNVREHLWDKKVHGTIHPELYCPEHYNFSNIREIPEPIWLGILTHRRAPLGHLMQSGYPRCIEVRGNHYRICAIRQGFKNDVNHMLNFTLEKGAVSEDI